MKKIIGYALIIFASSTNLSAADDTGRSGRGTYSHGYGRDFGHVHGYYGHGKHTRTDATDYDAYIEAPYSDEDYYNDRSYNEYYNKLNSRYQPYQGSAKSRNRTENKNRKNKQNNYLEKTTD